MRGRVKVRLLRSDKHHVPPGIAPEASHRCKIFSKPLAVARFEGLPKLLDGVACDLFYLFDFHFSCPPVSGSPCSLHPQPGERGRETEDRSGEIGVSRSERAARVSDTGVLVARSVPVETRGGRIKRRGRDNLEAGRTAEQNEWRQNGYSALKLRPHRGTAYVAPPVFRQTRLCPFVAKPFHQTGIRPSRSTVER